MTTKKRGRPKTEDGEARITIRLPLKLVEALQQKADLEDRSVASLVRLAIQRVLGFLADDATSGGSGAKKDDARLSPQPINDLPIRARNAVGKLGASTPQDLLRHYESCLTAQPTFGHTSMESVRAMMSSLGLNMRAGMHGGCDECYARQREEERRWRERVAANRERMGPDGG